MSDFQLLLICLGIAGIVYFTIIPPITFNKIPNRYGNKTNTAGAEPEKTYAEMKTLMDDINEIHEATNREKIEIEKTKLEMVELMHAIKLAHEETFCLQRELREENYLHEQALRGLLIDDGVLKEVSKAFPSSNYVLSSLVITDLYAAVPTSTVHLLAVCKKTGIPTRMYSDGSINLTCN